jgi:hypothetical protein
VPFFFAEQPTKIGTPTSAPDVKQAAGIILNVLYMPSSLSMFTYFEEQEGFQ